VICVEISVPPPEFCGLSDSRDERSTHWSFYDLTDCEQRIPQVINYIISGPFICVQPALLYTIIPAILSMDQRYYQLTRKESIPRKIRWLEGFQHDVMANVLEDKLERSHPSMFVSSKLVLKRRGCCWLIRVRVAHHQRS
jgi:hypothetical protein